MVSFLTDRQRGRGALEKVEVAGLTYTVQLARTNQGDINSHTLAPISSSRIEAGCSYLSAIRHFHIFRSAPDLLPPPPPQIFHNLCFSFLQGIIAVQKNENYAYAKFFGEKKWCTMGNVEVRY